MAIKINDLNHVALHVRDLDASVHFYENIIGLPRLPRPNFGFPGAWFALGAQELHLIVDPDIHADQPHYHHFALSVDDPYAARTELESKGLTEFHGPAPRPDGAVQLFFSDPDGHQIEMVSSPA